jgi:hypothetical protein
MGKRWSADEERILEESVKAGVTATEIAKRLGRSVVSVHDKISHLGLEARAKRPTGTSLTLSNLMGKISFLPFAGPGKLARAPSLERCILLTLGIYLI